MKKIIVILLIFAFSNKYFGQNIIFDSVQTINGNEIFKINILKMGEIINLKLTNKTDCNIYIVNSSNTIGGVIHEANDLEKGIIYLGQYINSLDDISYYESIKIKKGREIQYPLSIKSSICELKISIVINEKDIKKQKGKYYVKNPDYYEKKKTFSYLLKI